jgi:uncharacterized protein (DUF697 family)
MFMANNEEIAMKNREAASIIHPAAICSSIATVSIAQGAWFGFATAFLTPIIVWMIVSVGSLFGKKYEESALWSVFGVTLAAASGIVLANTFFGLFRLQGSLVDAGITLFLTEALGWGACKVFREGHDMIKAGEDEKRRANANRERDLSIQPEGTHLNIGH